MIYRFRARPVGSELTIEVQLQAPAGKDVDKLNEALRTSFSQQGVKLDSLQYMDSIDTESEG